MTEIFRAGIQAVPARPAGGCRALGMPERLVFRRIVLPQAVRIVVPAIGNEFIAMIKDSSLVSIITVQELLWRARAVGTRDARSIQAFLVAALVYWVLTIIFSYFQERLERTHGAVGPMTADSRTETPHWRRSLRRTWAR